MTVAQCTWCKDKNLHDKFCPFGRWQDWDDGLYGNDLPQTPQKDGQVVWVSLGDGWYGKLIADSGRWENVRSRDGLRYIQQ